MLLAIDVGNSHTVLGVFPPATEDPDGAPGSTYSSRLSRHWRVSTDARRTADELALMVRGLLTLGTDTAVPAVRITGVSICSVVPPVLHQLRDMCLRHLPGVPAVVVEPGVRTGVPVLTDNPKEVGADRIVNALAAMHLHGGPAVVVDFGTATTFDAVSARGELLGCAIAPGVEISIDALGAKGAQLRAVELLRPRSVIGKSTVEALQSGLLYGFAGQVDGLVDRMVRELGGTATVIATGGLAPLVLAESSRLQLYEPQLTLTGLRLIFEKNPVDRADRSSTP